MSKSKLQLIWWLCMLPSFVAMAMLSYEWYQHQSEIRFLIYAISCLIAGVFFGSLIVGTSASNEPEPRENNNLPMEMETELLPGMEPPPPKGTPEENWTGATVVQDPWWESSHPSFEEVKDQSEAEAAVSTTGEDGVVVRTDASVKAEAVPVAEKKVEKKAEPQKEKDTEEVALAREFLTPISERPEAMSSDSDGVSNMFQSFDASPGKASGEIEKVFKEAEPLKLDSEKANAKETAEELTAKILAAHKDDAAKDSGTADGGNVEKAQQVVARLEAEVAKAEAVAAKLENELKKAEPMAARLEADQKKVDKPQATPAKDTNANANKKPVTKQSTPSSQKSSGSINKSKGDTKSSLPDLKTTEEWLNHAEKMLAENKIDDAIKCYDNVTKLNSKNFDGWYLKGLAIRKKGRPEDAVYCFNYALGINDKSPLALTEKGECLLLSGKTDQALVAFDKSLQIDKVAPKPWLGKARCFAAMGKHKDAVACYDKVLAMQPDNEEAKAEKQTSAAKVSAKK